MAFTALADNGQRVTFPSGFSGNPVCITVNALEADWDCAAAYGTWAADGFTMTGYSSNTAGKPQQVAVMAVRPVGGNTAAQNTTPDYRSYAETGNPADIVPSPQVARDIGLKIDATNGQTGGLALDGSSTLSGLTVERVLGRFSAVGNRSVLRCHGHNLCDLPGSIHDGAFRDKRKRIRVPMWQLCEIRHRQGNRADPQYQIAGCAARIFQEGWVMVYVVAALVLMAWGTWHASDSLA